MPLECALYYSNGHVGSNSKGAREGSSKVVEYDHRVYTPTDDQRGIFTGARVHGAVQIVKEIDTASAGLLQACTEGQTLDELKVEWFRISPTGGEELYYTVTLSDVRVASVEQILPNTLDPTLEKQTHLERVRFLYERINWKHEEGYEYEDAWKDAVKM